MAIVTAGGTREPIDEVRHIANQATGALPCAIAEALIARGWHVVYLHGPGAARPGCAHPDIDVLRAGWRERAEAFVAGLAARAERLEAGTADLIAVDRAMDVADQLRRQCAQVQPDAVVCAMAVADFAPRPVEGKIQSRADSLGGLTGGGPTALRITLDATPKAIDGVREAASGTLLLGFKLLAGASEATLVGAARHLIGRSGADAVFANDMRDARVGRRRGVIVGRDGAITARLDGGDGDGATERLGGAIADWVATAVAHRRSMA